MARSNTLSAADLKPGVLIIIKGIRVEVTHSRRSRQYRGYQAVQYRPAGDTDLSRVQVLNLRSMDQMEVAS